MKGSVYPRPSVRDEDGKLRPVRGSTWTYAFSVGPRDRRRQISKGGFRTKGLAEAALAEAVDQYGKGERIEPSKVTVRTYLEGQWLPSLHHLKPTTRHGYTGLVANKVLPRLGDLRLDEVTGGHLGDLYDHLRTSGKQTKKGGGLSEQSIRHVHTLIHKAFEDAVRRRLIARNPADDVDPPKAEKREMETWTGEQLRTFLASTADDRLHGAWVLAVSTGLRRGELLGLRWTDLDLDAGQLAVRRSRVAVGYDVAEGTPKSGKARTVALDEGTVSTLRQHRRRQLEERMAWGAAWEDTGALFTKEDGSALHPHTLVWHFKKAQRSAGVPRLRLHDLRHTHATLALQAGVHPKVVQERLGHSSIAITLDLYSHVVPGMQEDAAAKVGAVIFGT